MMGEQGTARKVREAVEDWTPSAVMDHERKYQSELQEYLDDRLNSGSDLIGDGTDHVVSTERGTSKGDVVVDDVVGIEMKRNFSNSQKKKLRGQLEDYGDNYPYVIALACGVDDLDGWRELKNKYENQQSIGMGPDATEYHFIAKDRDTFGSTGTSSSAIGSGASSLGSGGSGDGIELDTPDGLFDEGDDDELGPFGVAGVAIIAAAIIGLQMPLTSFLLNMVMIVGLVGIAIFAAYMGLVDTDTSTQ